MENKGTEPRKQKVIQDGDKYYKEKKTKQKARKGQSRERTFRCSGQRRPFEEVMFLMRTEH